jgi:hypothetical protein
MTGHPVAFSVKWLRVGYWGEARVYRERIVEVLVPPRKGHWALNLRMLESLSMGEKRCWQREKQEREYLSGEDIPGL